MGLGVLSYVVTMPSVRHSAGGVGSVTDLHIIGGYNGTSVLSSTTEYDGVAWAAGPNILSTTRDLMAFNDGTTPMYTGGWSGSGSTRKTATYELTGGAWVSMGAALTEGKSKAGISGDATQAILSCGIDSTNTFGYFCQEYDGVTWSDTANAGSTSRYQNNGINAGASSSYEGGFLGGAASFSSYDHIYYYNGSTWSLRGNLPDNAYANVCIGTEDGATLVGGNTSTPMFFGIGAIWGLSGANLDERRWAAGTNTPGSEGLIAGGHNGATVGNVWLLSDYSDLTVGKITEAIVAGGTSISLTNPSAAPVVSYGDTIKIAIITKDDDVPTTVSNPLWVKELGFESNNAIYIEIWIAPGSVTGTTTWTGDSEEYCGQAFSVAGVDLTLPFEFASTLVGASINPQTPALSSVASNAVFFTGYGMDQDNTATSFPSSNRIGGFGKVVSSTGAGGCSMLNGISVLNDSFVGYTATALASDQWGGWTFAVISAEPPATGVTVALTSTIATTALGDILYTPTLKGIATTPLLGDLGFAKDVAVVLGGIETTPNIGAMSVGQTGSASLVGLPLSTLLGLLGIQESGSAALDGLSVTTDLGTLDISSSSTVTLSGEAFVAYAGLIDGRPGSPVTLGLSSLALVHAKSGRLNKYSRANSTSFIMETTTNTGISQTLGLTSVDGYGRFSDVLQGGQPVQYCITSGDSVEIGLGKYLVANRLYRETPLLNIINGVSTDHPSRLSLVGVSIVTIKPTAESLNQIYENEETKAFMLQGSF